MAGLEANAMSSCQLGGDLHSTLPRYKELRKILLFPSHFSIHHTDRATGSRCYSGRLNERDLVLYHSKMVETFGTDRLVRRCDSMLLLTLCLLRQHYYVLLA